MAERRSEEHLGLDAMEKALGQASRLGRHPPQRSGVRPWEEPEAGSAAEQERETVE
jgi:hypothetical protein